MSSANLVHPHPDLPLCVCPPPNDYFARIGAFAERLVAAMTPQQGKLIWTLVFIYLAVLMARRIDHLVERLLARRFLLPPPTRT
ncbi:hypothetical protein N7517_008511 [Penicillium concentricum]|uniref:Uncharacterized protein n=1 Tax=Penicillium concentricum TaxID=293559 RepID=A0A9W9RU04_9EURO|nr:uncharacterized protein N7517_008511 [Penicillium concentricum]KAJ5365625.1 hypothetical protein N7517_008511 [Penicillium concentricum]